MGCWGSGPFDSDCAADFATAVEHCSGEQARTELLTAMLGEYLKKDLTTEDFDSQYEFPSEVEEAVASAAFVADSHSLRREFTNTPYAQGQTQVRGEDVWYFIPLARPEPELVALARGAMTRLLGQMRAAGVDNDWRESVMKILEALA